MGELKIRSIKDHVNSFDNKSLLVRIRQSGKELNATGCEIALHLLGLAKTGNETLARDYCSAYLQHCKKNNIMNGEDNLHFFSEVADWYHQTKHRKMYDSRPLRSTHDTRNLIAKITGYTPLHS